MKQWLKVKSCLDIFLGGLWLLSMLLAVVAITSSVYWYIFDKGREVGRRDVLCGEARVFSVDDYAIDDLIRLSHEGYDLTKNEDGTWSYKNKYGTDMLGPKIKVFGVEK